MKQIYFLTILLLILSCNSKKEEVSSTQIVQGLYTFSEPGVVFGQPYLFTAPSGVVYLSWVERVNEVNKMMYSELSDSNWSPPRTIAFGNDWFVNWADYPQLAAFEDGTLVAFYLQKSSPSTFSYDIMLTFSSDGENWTDPFALHDDGTHTEHGFVSMLPWGENMFFTWLDGRHTSGGGHHNHDHGHGGTMTLRAAVLNTEGAKLVEWELDDRVCDCCQTTSSMGVDGPVVFYRDRSAEEVRDIYWVAYEGTDWSSPMPVYNDFWEIAGCPVNGPRSASLNGQSAVTWFSGAKGKSTVKTAFFEEEQNLYGEATLIDLGKPTGRVDMLMLDDNLALVSWMEEGGIYLRTVERSGQKSAPFLVGNVSGTRSSGFPQMTDEENHVILAWTDDSEDTAIIKTMRINKNLLTHP